MPFLHFSYKVLGVLLRLVKSLDAILCEKKNHLPAIKLSLLLCYRYSGFHYLSSRKNCRQLLYKQFLLLSDSNTFYIGLLFITASFYLICYFISRNILSRDTRVLFLLWQRFFFIFFYKVLGVLPKLIKGLNTILYRKNINFFSIQVFIVYLKRENYLYFWPHHICTRFFCLAQAWYYLI